MVYLLIDVKKWINLHWGQSHKKKKEEKEKDVSDGVYGYAIVEANKHINNNIDVLILF